MWILILVIIFLVVWCFILNSRIKLLEKKTLRATTHVSQSWVLNVHGLFYKSDYFSDRLPEKYLRDYLKNNSEVIRKLSHFRFRYLAIEDVFIVENNHFGTNITLVGDFDNDVFINHLVIDEENDVYVELLLESLYKELPRLGFSRVLKASLHSNINDQSDDLTLFEMPYGRVDLLESDIKHLGFEEYEQPGANWQNDDGKIDGFRSITKFRKNFVDLWWN